MRKLILSAALVAASVFGMTAVQAAEPVAGKEYFELSNPVQVSVPGKIEVVELFWYGCPHCYHFEPVINPGLKNCHRMSTSSAYRPCLAAHGTLMARCS